MVITAGISKRAIDSSHRTLLLLLKYLLMNCKGCGKESGEKTFTIGYGLEMHVSG